MGRCQGRAVFARRSEPLTLSQASIECPWKSEGKTLKKVLASIRVFSAARAHRVLSAARAHRVLSAARAHRVLSTARVHRVLSAARAHRVLSAARVHGASILDEISGPCIDRPRRPVIEALV